MLPIAVKNVYELTEQEELHLHVRWMTLCQTLHIPADAAEDIYDQIYYEYRGSHRAYHNLSHIQSLLALLDLYQSHLQESLTVELAIWFHDFIYQPQKQDNEIQSAQWAVQLLQPFIPQKQLETVRLMILSTEGHQPRTDHPDCLYFLDFDLAILATAPAIYQQYSAAIADEYRTWHSFFTYNAGRKRVMARFLERPRLYFSSFFFDQYEQQARENIQREVAR